MEIHSVDEAGNVMELKTHRFDFDNISVNLLVQTWLAKYNCENFLVREGLCTGGNTAEIFVVEGDDDRVTH